MIPTLGMTRPLVYSALTYRLTYNRNIPAYNIPSAARTNMMRLDHIKLLHIMKEDYNFYKFLYNLFK